MKFKEIITVLLGFVLPYIEELIKSKVIPAIIRKSYETFDNKANNIIKKLVALLEKIKATDDINKKNRHLEGFTLGVKTIKAIGEKLIKAAEVLEEELRV